MSTFDERCRTCNTILQVRRNIDYCPNGCSQLTAQAPDHDNHDSMLQDQIGESGCYIRRRAYTD